MNNYYYFITTLFKKSYKYLSFLILAGLLPVSINAQTVPTEGMKDNTPNVHAFTNATIVVSPGNEITNGTLVIRNGVIEAVGENVQTPADARVWDMEGKTLYPGFIDPYSNVGMNEPRAELDRGNLSWNPHIRAQLTAYGEFSTEDDGSEKLRSQGFTTAMSVPPLGIFKGETSVMNLGSGSASDRLVQPNIAQAVTLNRSWDFGFVYPTSPIGTIALIRQTLYDADWHYRAHETYRNNPQGLQRPESNAALEALSDAVYGNQPLIFETSSDEEILRALRFTDEFTDLNIWIRGNGHEYKVLDVLSQHNVPLILPVNFPDTPNIKTPEDALNEDLATLRHWYIAPENPKRLADDGLDFSFTADGLEDHSDFLKNVRKSVQLGLNPDVALAALTSNPANLLGLESTHGTLESGKKANILVTDGDIFDQKSKVVDLWVEGERFSITPESEIDVRGEWEISSTQGVIDGTLNIEETRPGTLGGTITIDGNEIELATVSAENISKRVRVDFMGDTLGIDGPVRLSASISGEELYGWAEVTGRERIQWNANRISEAEESEEEIEEFTPRDFELTNIRPAMEFGLERIPERPQHVLVQNATVWTMGPQGILENADLLITNGEVAEVGQNLSAPNNAEIIDAEGKHVTPGLIDAHLHSGSDGVNEVGNAIVPEVRLGDVLNINNIWMYRQVAGGLTTAHVMHGSANPIGGQNQHIKMRWGALSDDLKFEDAPRTVKFALGENPKRVGSDRYPETRMGVEQIIEDRFRMARDYEAKWNEWEASGDGIPPRRDIRLDAIVDILNEDILVQSHSYRQDEILMLMRLAERFDFTIKAFHHGVEAYKVAPELAEHGAGAVVWSDWGGFKIEAYDNTNYNARLLSEAGVKTSLHSDNSQIASRMNWEAAKMVRTGVEPEDALAMVTITTAELLGIDHRVGSLEPGKDADFVIWSGDPLSTFTKPEQTWIDGRKYFDLEKDAELRNNNEQERAQLIRLIMEENND